MTRELRRIDETRPKAEVCGLPGVCFEQDGILFTSAGVELLPEDYTPPAEDETPPDNPDDPMIGVVVIQGSEAPEALQSKSSHDSFDKLHHMQLKALVKSYGFDYVDRPTAIEQLRGLKKSA